MGKCRRTGVAALILASLSLGVTGCLSSSRYQKDDGPAYPRSASRMSAAPGYTIVGNAPGGVMATPAGRPLQGGEIQRTGYFQEGEVIIKDKDRPPYVGGPAHPVEGFAPPQPGCPTEKAMVTHPPYTVAAPDILVIDAVRMIPRPPYRIEPLEILLLNVTDTLPGQPISGPFVVSPEGGINLGFTYGSVPIVGLTLEQAQNAIKTHLGSVLKMPQVTIALAQFRGMQQVRGQHLVRPDGTISMGTYGSVFVAGMTLGQVKCVVEKHLSEYILNPQVSVDVYAYNSKFYYIILDGAGLGQQVVRIPSTGNETVLDAIATVQGLAPVSSKKRIWLARPSPVHSGCNQVLPIDWQAIAMGGSTATNYQTFPGDRIYVSGDPLITFDNNLAKILAPVERILGVSLLGASTVQTFQNLGNGGNRLNNGNGIVVVP